MQPGAVQGGALNRGPKRFFSTYTPSCHIEAYIRHEKNCFVWAGPLANHPFNFNFIFLSEGLTAAAERAACFADLYRR
jgi:exonuclease I